VLAVVDSVLSVPPKQLVATGRECLYIPSDVAFIQDLKVSRDRSSSSSDHSGECTRGAARGDSSKKDQSMALPPASLRATYIILAHLSMRLASFRLAFSSRSRSRRVLIEVLEEVSGRGDMVEGLDVAMDEDECGRLGGRDSLDELRYDGRLVPVVMGRDEYADAGSAATRFLSDGSWEKNP
jgi:hypothetical protein